MAARTFFDIIIGCGLTLFTTIVALALANLGVEAPYWSFVLSGIAAVIVGGAAAGTVAISLSTAATWFFFIPPLWSFEPPKVPYLITITLFVAVVICSCRLYLQQKHLIDELADVNVTLRQKLYRLGRADLAG